MAQPTVPRVGSGRPAGADSGQTRSRILEAAQQFFADQGYLPATNQAIAAAAGVTTGSVYYHFGSKQKLFAAVVDYSYRWLLDQYRKTIVPQPGLPELIHELLTVSMRLHRERPSLAGFITSSAVEARRFPELAQYVESPQQEFLHMLTQWVRASDPAVRTEDEVSIIANLVLTIMEGFASRATIESAQSLERWAEMVPVLFTKPPSSGA